MAETFRFFVGVAASLAFVSAQDGESPTAKLPTASPCPLSSSTTDPDASVMTNFGIDEGIVHITFQEEMQWLNHGTPELVSGSAGCAEHFVWVFEEFGCQFRQWNGTISVIDLLDGCVYTVEDEVGHTQVRVNFEVRSERPVDVYMAAKIIDTISSFRTFTIPLLFYFQNTVDVNSETISISTLSRPVTVLNIKMDGSLESVDDVQKDYIASIMSDQLKIPAPAIDFSFSSGSIVVQAVVPGSVKTDACDALDVPGYTTTSLECTPEQQQTLAIEVTERSIVSAAANSQLIPEATVSVYTKTRYPFELVDPQHVHDYLGLSYGDFTTHGSCSPGESCLKEFRWILKDDNAIAPRCTFSGTYQVELQVQCTSLYPANLGCPLNEGEETVLVTLNMESADHCAVSELPVSELEPTEAADLAALAAEGTTCEIEPDCASDVLFERSWANCACSEEMALTGILLLVVLPVIVIAACCIVFVIVCHYSHREAHEALHADDKETFNETYAKSPLLVKAALKTQKSMRKSPSMNRAIRTLRSGSPSGLSMKRSLKNLDISSGEQLLTRSCTGSLSSDSESDSEPTPLSSPRRAKKFLKSSLKGLVAPRTERRFSENPLFNELGDERHVKWPASRPMRRSSSTGTLAGFNADQHRRSSVAHRSATVRHESRRIGEEVAKPVGWSDSPRSGGGNQLRVSKSHDLM